MVRPVGYVTSFLPLIITKMYMMGNKNQESEIRRIFLGQENGRRIRRVRERERERDKAAAGEDEKRRMGKEEEGGEGAEGG